MKERSTLQPFAPGDVFVGSTVLDGAHDDHAGRGRILQYDSQLRRKGVLWLTQTTHLVGGLRFDRQGRLWAFDSQAFVVLTVGRDGSVQKRDFGTRPFSNVNFCADGSLYLAEHVTGNGIKMEIQARMGTRLQKMPGTERLGDGHVWHFQADGTLLRELSTQVHGGVGGFMGVTMSALSPDESQLVYCSETGTRLMRYDLESARQLPDLQCLPEGEREMFFAMDYGPQGRLYVSRGNRVDLVSPEGRTKCSYPLEGHGWATLEAAADGRHLYIGNYFSGELVKLELESGEYAAIADTGVAKSLAGIAEFVGERGEGAVARRARSAPAKRAGKSRQPKRSRKPRQKKRKARSPRVNRPGKPRRAKRSRKAHQKKRTGKAHSPRVNRLRKPRKRKSASAATGARSRTVTNRRASRRGRSAHHRTSKAPRRR
jgi:sugar lactone lactonase YvrE